MKLSWVDHNNIYIPNRTTAYRYYFLLKNNEDTNNSVFYVSSDNSGGSNYHTQIDKLITPEQITINGIQFKVVSGIIHNYWKPQFSPNTPHVVNLYRFSKDTSKTPDTLPSSTFCQTKAYRISERPVKLPIQESQCSGDCFAPETSCSVCTTPKEQGNCQSNEGIVLEKKCVLSATGAYWQDTGNKPCNTDCVAETGDKGTLGDCTWLFKSHQTGQIVKSPFPKDNKYIDFEVSPAQQLNFKYELQYCRRGLFHVSGEQCFNVDKVDKIDNTLKGYVRTGELSIDIEKLILRRIYSDNTKEDYCMFPMKWREADKNTPSAECELTVKPDEIDSATEVNLTGRIKNVYLVNLPGISGGKIQVIGDNKFEQIFTYTPSGPRSGDQFTNFNKSLGDGFPPGNYKIISEIDIGSISRSGVVLLPITSAVCESSFQVSAPKICNDSSTCPKGTCNPTCHFCPWCDYKTPEDRNSVVAPNLEELCMRLDEKYRGDCYKCIQGDRLQTEYKSKNPIPGIWTAIGCLPIDLPPLFQMYIFTYGIGMVGGIAFLYLIYGFFLILTSGGNAEKIEQAKQIIISALSGLILIIFSVLLLKIIGTDIIRIPGFG